jgi:hypothetical protein
MGPAQSERLVVGLEPWLPWPLSRWRWWTEPVRAERLAALRIALAACLLADLFLTYVPHFHENYGADSLGAPALFDYQFEFNTNKQEQRWYWSVLRGPADPLNRLALTVGWLLVSVWVVRGMSRRLRLWPAGEEPSNLRWGLGLWTVFSVLGLSGWWAQLKGGSDAEHFLTLASGGLVWGIASVNLSLGLWKRLRGPVEEQDPFILPLVLVAWTVSTLFLLAGLWRAFQGQIDPSDFLGFSWVKGRWNGQELERWDADHKFLQAALVLWIIATVFMLLGLWTRLSVVVVWLLSISFENMNSYNDNAGDQVRGIALFYLMLCPCGAAWSLDSCLARWWGRRKDKWARWLGRPDGPVYVSPWALRLLVFQMAYIYCVNGIYKLAGTEWTAGTSLYFVLNDLTLARWSYAQIPIPLWMTQVLSKSVLIWEVCFPLFLLIPWMVAGLVLIRPLRSKASVIVVRILRILRAVALLFGVAFHLGIFFMLELGFFGPYMICLYAPFVPWERWIGRRRLKPALNVAASA